LVRGAVHLGHDVCYVDDQVVIPEEIKEGNMLAVITHELNYTNGRDTKAENKSAPLMASALMNVENENRK
jgi:hypothetical protein